MLKNRANIMVHSMPYAMHAIFFSEKELTSKRMCVYVLEKRVKLTGRMYCGYSYFLQFL